jgi:hypothetical protein
MAAKPKRVPWLNLILLFVVVLVTGRSLLIGDVISWDTIEDQRSSLIHTSWGIDVGNLGLSLFYDQRLVPYQNARQAARVASDMQPGLQLHVRTLPKNLSWLRRLGMGFQREFDDRPAVFRNKFELTIPLWLIAILLSIAPLRHLVARRKSQSPRTENHGRRSNALIIVVAVAAGVVIGSVITFFLVRKTTTTTAPPAASTQPQPPVHPIVGEWTIHIDPIIATYRFNNDHTFVLTFRMPAARPITADAGGTWTIEGNTLVLLNKWSHTPLTVVGEAESAQIMSIEADQMVLEHDDRRGRREPLMFSRVH